MDISAPACRDDPPWSSLRRRRLYLGHPMAASPLSFPLKFDLGVRQCPNGKCQALVGADRPPSPSAANDAAPPPSSRKSGERGPLATTAVRSPSPDDWDAQRSDAQRRGRGPSPKATLLTLPRHSHFAFVVTYPCKRELGELGELVQAGGNTHRVITVTNDFMAAASAQADAWPQAFQRGIHSPAELAATRR